MKINNVMFKAGGEAGTGVATIGAMFAKLMQRQGLYVLQTNDYPSLIRGGHNTITVRASTENVYALDGQVDILMALDRLTIAEHFSELTEGGAIVYDSTRISEEDAKVPRKDVMLIPVPMTEIARKAGGELYFNQVGVGATIAVLGMDFTLVEKLIQKTFGRKGEDVVKKNIAAAKEGYDLIHAKVNGSFGVKIQFRKLPANTLLIGGNDAVCVGSICAGVKMVAEYPMSPSSSVLHWMAAHAIKYNIVVKHTEDEIAAANWLCGAGFAGVRAMTATSGGGFSLMAEAIGNAGIAEIPIVIVNDMRAGPSTGLPTYTEQGDLQFALRASQGDFDRIVACPGDPEEAFYTAFDVFNMAEDAQCPAIILMDKYIAETQVTMPQFDLTRLIIDRGALQTDLQMEGAVNFRRHLITHDGISPRSIPGQKNGIHVCSSYEHDETGYTSEKAEMKVAQVDKRARKFSTINPSLYQPAFYGDPKSTFLLVCWGSTKGPALEALKILGHENMHIRLMQIKYASPFATETIKQALQNSSKVLICEGNSSGQMRDLICEKTGVHIENIYLKYDGRPFEPAAIAQKVRELAKK